VDSRFIENGLISLADIENQIWPKVSIILPILNEAKNLAQAVGAIGEQKYPGEFEIILALGPSKDMTNEIANKLAANDSRIKLVDSPTGRTPNSLNLAIKNSNNPIIARIDGHAEISPYYLVEAVRTLLETGAVNVGGVMAAQGRTIFEKTVATAMRSPIGVGASKFHTGGNAGEVDTVYLGTFEKRALEKIGGYDEHFTRAQDWEMNFRLRQQGGKIWFNPKLEVIYRPRPTLFKLAKQYFQYGRWRHVVVRSHKGSVNFRYLAPPTVTAAIILAILLTPLSPVFLLIPGSYLLGILLSSILIGKGVREKVIMPIVLLTMHLAWGAGYLTSPRKLATTKI
jgi:glycosyltransferase involved in cell wall biosynthesis